MQDQLFDVSNKIVVITGGMGQLGRQFSLAFAQRGAKVALFDLRINNAIVSEQFAPHQDNMLFVEVDVTQRSSIEDALHQVQKHWGVPEVLVNNAALDSPPNAPATENGPFETYPEHSWNQVLEVNVKGPFLCCQVIGNEMAKAGRGSIINISSIYGLVSPDQRIYEYRFTETPFFKPVAYSVSKSSLFNLTRYLATYWADKGVRVNTLTFGGVFNNQDKQFLQGYCHRVPMGRMAREDEYNGAVIFLASEASSYMTGSNVILDGGWTAW